MSGHLPGNRKVPGSMPGCGILLLLFPWARKFTPIAPATQLLNRKILCMCIPGHNRRAASVSCCYHPCKNVLAIDIQTGGGSSDDHLIWQATPPMSSNVLKWLIIYNLLGALDNSKHYLWKCHATSNAPEIELITSETCVHFDDKTHGQSFF